MTFARHPGVDARRAGLALVLAVLALVAMTASALAEPPSTDRPAAGAFTSVTLKVSVLPTDGPLAEPETLAPSPEPAVYVEHGAAPIPTLAPRPQREARVGVTVKPTPKPKPDIAGFSGGSVGGDGSLRGGASWYCRSGVSVCHNQYPDTNGFDAYAAAGPRLRDALGNWRGKVVSVDGIRVKLVDWCQCYKGQSNEKLIDLYYDVYKRVGGSVTIRW
jgi:hypothetical protein